MLDDGIIYSFGSSAFGCLGRHNIEFNEGSAIPAPITVLQTSFIHKIVAGKNHSLALDVNGLIYSWGDNSEGQCGVASSVEVVQPSTVHWPDSASKIEDIVAGAYHSALITTEGRAIMFGSGDCGCLGFAPSDTTSCFTQVRQ